MTPLIETPRLRLRAPGFGDAKRLADFLGNFSVAGNLARVPHPYTIDDARSWLAGWRAGAPANETGFIIEYKGEGAIGVAGFHNNGADAELGYWIGEPFWGQGIISEALYSVLDWYFDTTPADYIVSGVFHFNMASAAVQMKLGFVETGRSMRHCLARGEEVEHIDTELTREAYVLSRPKSKKVAAQ